MLAFPRKRPRSPSPTHDTSPLDVFLKRRRQANIHVNSEDAFELNPLQPYPQADGNVEEEYGREDRYARFVERRRTKQWERQNAPQSSSQAQEHSTPDTAQRHASSNPAVRGASQSPLPRVYSQPENRFQMSSSPVRHHPPSSSPFRPSQSSLSNGPTGSSSSDATRFDEEWGMDEMRREWGDEYVNQNSLLHQLHLARATQGHRLGRQVSSIQTQSSPHPAQTPEETPSYLLQTPSSVHIPSAPYDYTTHRGHRGNPSSDTQYHMASSPYSHLHNTPYSHLNNTPESSAEYTPAPQRYAGGMEFDTPAGKPENGDAMEEEIRIRYEETNRLLAELEVVRRNRWGEQ